MVKEVNVVEAVTEVLKLQLLPEIHELKQDVSWLKDHAIKTDQRLERLENGMELLNKRMDLSDQRFVDVDRRFVDFERRFDDIDKRFNLLDRRLDGIETAVNGMQTLFLGMQNWMNAFGGRLDQIQELMLRIGTVVDRIDKRQEGHEQRLSALEKPSRPPRPRQLR